MTTAQQTRVRARPKRNEPLLFGAAGILTLLILLQTIPTIGIVNPKFFPPLSEILQALMVQFSRPEFWSAFGSTILGWLLGLAIATALGVILGILLASVPVLGKLMHSTIEFLRPIPSVALVPLAVLLFGTTMNATLLLVIYASLWQVLFQVMYGVKDVDPVAIDTAKSYRLSTWTTIRRVIWPSITPYVIIGVRLAAAVALVLEITGELVIGSPGIGKLIVTAQSSGATASMYSLVLIAALLGVVVNIGARTAEQKLLFWHASIRTEAH
ncbi:ABC transporter permease [Lysinibacter cavernae]|nr:ABC transporter permease [Lysinibacter cavernae]